MALLKRKRAGLSDAMAVVTRFVNACNRHDADAIFACLHPNFDSIQPMYPSRNFRGADQVRRNWQAIFDAEPGFRLTVLRSAVADDIVWLELHGAGQDAEVAGVFVMGIQGDRIRWARIYSALVEPLPPGADDGPARSADVSVDSSQPAGAGNGEVIAPVVDIERPGRRRRRSRVRREEAAAPPKATAAAPATTAEAPAAVEPEPQPEPVPQPKPEPVAETAAVAEPRREADPVVAVEPETAAVVVREAAEAEPEVLVAPGTEPEPATGAHDMVSELATGEEKVIVVQPEPEPPKPEPEVKLETAERGDDGPKRRFGKKSR